MQAAAGVAREQHVYGWSLVARAQEIELWRRAVADVFRGWGASPAAVEVARLGVSELLSNIIRHVECPQCYLRIVRVGGEAVVQVFDRSSEFPVVGRPEWDADSGRGLWLLREMADRFGWEATHPRVGKIVWFACRLREESR
ncbi:ATP-binding protein [Streptomyces millisiae]|uniref:ATP-binding protein n=1 Tax=Streptomyces millisiae TaxID=3075542 RepID=A0ABU2LJJ3_9ACTN|nr:ATP-binding protein [Streptomyces sp. DSM 44918]MDT0317293.1 ATP-binding protein [Streptomyces sp. DSM 44918]